jgi:hypothetical protein
MLKNVPTAGTVEAFCFDARVIQFSPVNMAEPEFG